MTQIPVGKVYIVGGGPGDPGLLTLRGAACLAQADVVLYDYLINADELSHAPQAQLVCLGRHGHDRPLEQEEINAQLIQLALAGKTVVRLKGGDPAVFAHLTEEVEALRGAGVPYEVVPGITAAMAAATYAGFPLTQRDAASAVAFVTGQEGAGKQPQLDFASLAAFPGTLVFYMGVTTVRHWTAALVAAGKSTATPVAAVRRASWPDQQVFHATLGTVAAEVEARRLRPPAVFVVGEVAALAGSLDWFSARPLAGVYVLVTRPAGGHDRLSDQLADLGAAVLRQPAIEISPPADWHDVDRALANLGSYDWLVFSSVHGVEAIVQRLLGGGRDLRALATIKLAAIGPGTADALARYHLRADVVPDEFRAESLAAALSPHAASKKFLLVRASRGRDVLPKLLAAAGGIIDEVIAYTSRDVPAAAPEIVERLRAGKLDWITVTSSAVARALASLLGPNLGRAKLASLSPITTATLAELGYRPTVEAAEYTMPGLVAAMRAWHESASS